MMTKITLALALAFAAISAVPASAAPSNRANSSQPYTGFNTLGTEHTCGSAYLEYDSSGAPQGPYCH